jgi:6-phosphogluconolactonase
MGNASHAGEGRGPLGAAAHLLQVHERIAPAGDPKRNLTHLPERLLQNTPLDPAHIYAMPVDSLDRLGAAAEYAMTLRKVAGSPPVLDVARIGHLPRPVEFKTDSAT